jgi:hypothetical protein
MSMHHASPESMMSLSSRPPSSSAPRLSGLRRACAAAATLSPLLAPAAPPVSWPVAPYVAYVHAVATGQPTLALDQFAHDAVVVAGPHCTAAAPCRGPAAIRQGFLQPAFALGLHPPVAAQTFDGKRLRARGEAVVPVTYVFELRGGRIAALHVEASAPCPRGEPAP